MKARRRGCWGSIGSSRNRSRRSRARADKLRFPLLPTYEHVLKCSHLFNTLDARGAISVTERVAVIARVRKLAVGVAEAWMDQQSADAATEPAEAVHVSLPFLLEIGTEEIPDWMIEPALESLRSAVSRKQSTVTADATMDATPRRLVLRADRLPEQQADEREENCSDRPNCPRSSRRRLRAQAGRASRLIEVQQEDGHYVFLEADSRPHHA